MNETNSVAICIYDTKTVGIDIHGADVVDYELVIHEALVRGELTSRKDAIIALVVIRDALEHYEGVTTHPEYKRIVLEAMSGVDDALKQLVI